MTENAGKCIKYLKKNTLTVATLVNNCFNERKDGMRKYFMEEIKSELLGNTVHYVWKRGNCPWDDSGELVQDGNIDLQQTVNSFMENEYTGAWEATYESGHGMRYLTYGDAFSYTTLEIGETIMCTTIKNHLEDIFHIELTKEEWDDIIDECHDRIYDECLASDFFWCKEAMEFVNIGEMTLDDLLEEVW